MEQYEYPHLKWAPLTDVDLAVMNELGLKGWRIHTLGDGWALLERKVREDRMPF